MIEEKKFAVQIKGVRDGLLINLSEGEWHTLKQELLQQIQERAAFFNGAMVALDVGNRILRTAEIGELKDKLAEFGINLWAVISDSSSTEQAAKVLGLATRILTSRRDRQAKAADLPSEGESAVIIRRSLRSGTRIVSQGSLVIIGDVHLGAEIIATGSVIIWGQLSGVVHAGADGDEKAAIYALTMNPAQLRIANHIAGQMPRITKLSPVMAHISNGHVVAIHWETLEQDK